VVETKDIIKRLVNKMLKYWKINRIKVETKDIIKRLVNKMLKYWKINRIGGRK
jgi:hypothetical protein